MIQKVKIQDIPAVTELALLLWPGHTKDALAEEMAALVIDPEAALFLAWEGADAVGFAQCQLRHDYVEGTESSPVGYLEGIYVAEGYRKKGIAAALLRACESWAKTKGCSEFASDCELENTLSARFHRHLGFTEANRIICFTKKL